MQKLNLKTIILLLFISIFTAGCGGGDTTVQASNTTMGQELSDLDKAFKQGIISKNEYENAKEDILQRYKKY